MGHHLHPRLRHRIIAVGNHPHDLRTTSTTHLPKRLQCANELLPLLVRYNRRDDIRRDVHPREVLV